MTTKYLYRCETCCVKRWASICLAVYGTCRQCESGLMRRVELPPTLSSHVAETTNQLIADIPEETKR